MNAGTGVSGTLANGAAARKTSAEITTAACARRRSRFSAGAVDRNAVIPWAGTFLILPALACRRRLLARLVYTHNKTRLLEPYRCRRSLSGGPRQNDSACNVDREFPHACDAGCLSRS